MSPKNLQLRMAALQHLLFIPQQQALSMVRRQPQLLAYSSSTLVQRMLALRALLRVSTDLAMQVVGAHPNLLCYSTKLLQVRMGKPKLG